MAFLCLSLSAQVESDSIILHFRMNESRIDSSFADNRAQLDKLNGLLSVWTLTHRLDSLAITGSTSPDGLLSFNRGLAKDRASVLASHIHSVYPETGEVPVSIHSVSYDWKNMITALSQDSLLPNKDKVLEILHEESAPPYQKQLKLKGLQGGDVYQNMDSRHLAYYRNVICNLYFSPIGVTNEDVQVPDSQDSICYLPSLSSESDIVTTETSLSDSITVKDNLWRLGTNLLYWVALSWNAGIEYSLNNRSTLSLTGACAWWSRLSHERVYRWMDAELAYHYYLRPNKRHSGFFIGAYAQTGSFEMMFGKKNRKGETIAGGVSGGYRWLLNDRLALHVELGLGYAYTDYRYAVSMDNTLIRQGREYHHYIGPTRAAVSLVYELNWRTRP